MTLEKIIFNPFHLKIAFNRREREHLECLATRANHLLGLILAKTATDEEDKEYHSLKFVLKQIGSLDQDYLERAKHKGK